MASDWELLAAFHNYDVGVHSPLCSPGFLALIQKILLYQGPARPLYRSLWHRSPVVSGAGHARKARNSESMEFFSLKYF